MQTGQHAAPVAIVTLPRSLQQQLAALKAGWMFVGAAYQSEDEHCSTCPRNVRIVQSEGGVDTTFGDCSLGTRGGDKPLECPAYLDHVLGQSHGEVVQ